MTCYQCLVLPTATPTTTHGAAILCQLCSWCGQTLRDHSLNHPHPLRPDVALPGVRICLAYGDGVASLVQAADALKARLAEEAGRASLTPVPPPPSPDAPPHAWRVYLAAAYRRYPEMQEAAHLLVQHGHTVTSRWIADTAPPLDGDLWGAGALARSRQWAQDDVADVMAAECVLYFSEPGVLMRGGKAVKLGMALAWHKRVIVIGGFEHLFHCLDAVEHVPDLAAAIELLGTPGDAVSEGHPSWWRDQRHMCGSPQCPNLTTEAYCSAACLADAAL